MDPVANNRALAAVLERHAEAASPSSSAAQDAQESFRRGSPQLARRTGIWAVWRPIARRCQHSQSLLQVQSEPATNGAMQSTTPPVAAVDMKAAWLPLVPEENETSCTMTRIMLTMDHVSWTPAFRFAAEAEKQRKRWQKRDKIRNHVNNWGCVKWAIWCC